MRKQIHIPHSLSARIITGVVAAALLVGGASFCALQAFYRGQLIASRADWATVHGTLMDQTLRHAMLTRSLDHLSEMVRSLAEQKGVESVMILDKEGVLGAGYVFSRTNRLRSQFQ